MSLKQYIENCSNNGIKVDDLIFKKNENDKFYLLFILESPHTEEIKEGVPLAGKSGKSVYNILNIDDNKNSELSRTGSFGKFLSENKCYVEERRIGIVNVSNVPLQNIGNLDFEFPKELVDIREKQKLDDDIFEIFKEKFFKICSDITEDTCVVICGNFAQRYFKELPIVKDGTLKYKEIKLPHPSRNSWEMIDKYKDGLQKLKSLMQ